MTMILDLPVRDLRIGDLTPTPDDTLALITHVGPHHDDSGSGGYLDVWYVQGCWCGACGQAVEEHIKVTHRDNTVTVFRNE